MSEMSGNIPEKKLAVNSKIFSEKLNESFEEKNIYCTNDFKTTATDLKCPEGQNP